MLTFSDTHKFASGHKRPPTWQAGYLRGGMSKMQPPEMAHIEAQFSRSTNAFWGLRPQRQSLYVVFIRPLTASARSPMNNPIFSSSVTTQLHTLTRYQTLPSALLRTGFGNAIVQKTLFRLGANRVCPASAFPISRLGTSRLNSYLNSTKKLIS